MSRSDATTIERELRRIAAKLREPVTFVLFGGCNMSVRLIKTSTKDTDVVVYCTSLHPLLEDMMEAGYDTAEEPATIVFDGYVLAGTHGGLRIDLFPPDRIFDGPGFTKSMKDGSEHWFTAGNLEVRLAEVTVTFLFKAITGRWRTEPPRDLEDLGMLLARNLVDWGRVEELWPSFEACGVEVVAKAREAIKWLRAQGFNVPWEP